MALHELHIKVAAMYLTVQVVHTYEGHQADVHLLLPFGDHLISVDKGSAVIIWDVASQGLGQII